LTLFSDFLVQFSHQLQTVGNKKSKKIQKSTSPSVHRVHILTYYACPATKGLPAPKIIYIPLQIIGTL
jgi:hypothetical protein